MQKNHLKKIFKLKGYILDNIEYKNDKTYLYCHLQKRSMTYLGEISRSFHETRQRIIPHMLLENETILIVIIQRRFYFPRHKTRRWEPLPDVSSRKQTTDTFRLNTLRELQRDNYTGTGYKRHKSHMYPAYILDDLEMKLKWPEAVTKIGLDGKGVGHHKQVHNITNLNENKPLAVLPTLNQKQVKKNCKRSP